MATRTEAPARTRDRLPVAVERIEEELRRVLESPEFHATDSQRRFLQFVVAETLAEKAHEIKAYTVAVRVLGRGAEFNQAIDPIVSIHASELRRALERYYLTAGKRNPVRIDIPRGTYVPTFTEQMLGEADPFPSRNRSGAPREESWPSVLIPPFRNLSNNQDRDYLGVGFAIELATELARYQDLRVLQGGPEARRNGVLETGARFVLDGSIREDRTGFKVVVQLMDRSTNEQVWSDVLKSETNVSQLVSFQEDVARIVAAKIGGEQGIVSRKLSKDSTGKPPSELNTYEALLRFYDYEQSLLPDSFVRAFEALESARIKEPGCGQVWSSLARLHANIYSLEFPGFDMADALDKAASYAERGAHLGPDSQRARGVLAYVRMLANQIAAARREINLAYELNPNSLFMLDGIGYVMILLGDWERGYSLIRKAIALNPFYNPIAHYGLWVYYLNNRDFELAHEELMGLRRPDIFWYPLARAASLGLIGRSEEGRQYAKNLLVMKPDFSDHGRRLIQKYVKFQEIAELIHDGLRACGVDVR